jgi:hypothetical protein
MEHRWNSDSERPMNFQTRIEHYLKRSRTSPTRLGRLALNDPRFVFDLRKGRQVGEDTIARVNAWLDRQGARR